MQQKFSLSMGKKEKQIEKKKIDVSIQKKFLRSQ